MVCRTKASLANYNNVLCVGQVLGDDPLRSVAIIHFIVFALHAGGGVEVIHNLVCRTEAILANHCHVSRVGQALGDSRPVLTLPTSYASILLIFLYVYPTACQSQFCLRLLAPPIKCLWKASRLILNFEIGISQAVPGYLTSGIQMGISFFFLLNLAHPSLCLCETIHVRAQWSL